MYTKNRTNCDITVLKKGNEKTKTKHSKTNKISPVFHELYGIKEDVKSIDFDKLRLRELLSLARFMTLDRRKKYDEDIFQN